MIYKVFNYEGVHVTPSGIITIGKIFFDEQQAKDYAKTLKNAYIEKIEF